MSKAKAKAAKGTVELGPDSDPSVLYKNFVKECKDNIGIEPCGAVKDALTNEENPNLGKQIVILPSDGSVLGPGGCRALCNALMGKSTEIPFTGIKEIRICRSDIKDGGAAALATLLMATAKKPQQGEWKLEYIELIDNEIGPVGAQALGRSLCVGMNKTLSTLVLDFNGLLGSEGASSLCKGLSTNSTLRKLSLKHCNIDERGGKPIGDMLSFKRSGLMELDLTSNLLGPRGLEDICPGLGENTSLKTLRLGDNAIGASEEDADALEKFAAVLLKHSSIMGVDIMHNKIGTSGGAILLPAVSENNNITEFKVDANMDGEVFKSLFKVSSKKGKAKKGKGKKKK